MKKYYALWTKQCIQCQRAIVTRHTRSPIQQFDVRDVCFQQVYYTY